MPWALLLNMRTFDISGKHITDCIKAELRLYTSESVSRSWGVRLLCCLQWEPSEMWYTGDVTWVSLVWIRRLSCWCWSCIVGNVGARFEISEDEWFCCIHFYPFGFSLIDVIRVQEGLSSILTYCFDALLLLVNSQPPTFLMSSLFFAFPRCTSLALLLSICPCVCLLPSEAHLKASWWLTAAEDRKSHVEAEFLTLRWHSFCQPWNKDVAEQEVKAYRTPPPPPQRNNNLTCTLLK